MTHALMRQGCEVSFLLQKKEQGAAFVRLQDTIARLWTGRYMFREHDPRITGHFPEEISNVAASQHPVDAVLGVSPSHLATTNCPVSSIVWADTMSTEVRDRYLGYKHIAKRSIKECHSSEQAVLSSCTLVVFTNQWAADVACESYSFDQRKVRVIPYGANLLSTLTKEEIAECLNRRDAREYELLFVGPDWKRKGAQIAIDTTSVMRAHGVNVHLTLVGCVPPPAVSLPEYVTVIKKIDKSTPRGHALLASLYMQSHLLILPNWAETCAGALSEASAYGVPSLCTRLGGNGTFIKNGMNGQLFPLDAGATDYAEYALELLGDPQKYTAMCWSSFERFQTDLNWDVAVSRLIAEMKKVLPTASEAYACTRAS
jgi:glycosyltransferase involved in cell wall biosynthesis